MEKNNLNKLIGGFPPIILCDYEKKDKEIDNNIRGFSKNDEKIVVSLKQIMEDRKKDIKLFIEL